MSVDSRQIEYTIKLKNDPSNAAAMNAASTAMKGFGDNGYVQQLIKVKEMEKQTAQSVKEAAAARKAADKELALLAREKAQAIADAEKAARKEAAATKDGAKAHNEAAHAAKAHGGALHALHRLMQLTIALTVGNEIMKQVDEWTELTGAIRMNTENEGQALVTRQRLIDMSIRTHTNLDANVKMWEKLTTAGRSYKLSADQVMKVQETLNKGLQVGGATTAQAQNAMSQFVMLLNSGRASAIGFNAIFRESPELMEMLAKAMGKPLSYFTQMRKQGPAAMREILKAVQEVAPEIDEKFTKLPMTMAKGWQDAKTGFLVMIGEITEKMKVSGGVGGFFERLSQIFRDPGFIDGVSKVANLVGNVLLGALNALVRVIDFVSAHIEEFKAAMEVLAVIMVGKVVLGAVTMFRTFSEGQGIVFALGKVIGVAAEAMLGFNATMLLNPWVAAVAGIAAMSAALWVFGSALDASGEKAFTVKDVIVGAFQYARDAVIGIWRGFVRPMISIFEMVVGAAVSAASRVQQAFAGAFSYINNNTPFAGVRDKIHNALPSWMTADLTKAVSGAVGAAGRRGALDRVVGHDINKNLADIHTAQANLKANDELSKPLTGGAPLGSAPGGKKKKGSDKAGDAMKALQDYTEELTRAIEEQKKMNAAILEGPAAERAASVSMAKSKVILQETQKLEKAGIDLKKNKAAAAAVARAGELAETMELQKQAGERNKLTRSIQDQARAQQDEIALTRMAMTAWTGDIAMRRQQSRAIAEQTARQKELNKYKAAEYSNLTDIEKAAVDKAVKSAMDKFDTDQLASDLNAVKGLIDNSLTPDQQSLMKWEEMRLQVEAVTRAFPSMGAAAQEALAKAKPPESLGEALRKGIQGFADTYRSSWGTVAEGIKGTITNMADAFVEMAATGKISFKKLALSVVQDLERMIVKALIFKAIMAVMNAVLPGSGQVVGAVASSAGNFVGPRGHSGGIAGMGSDSMFSIPPAAFGMAKRYHTGGLAGLKSGEVPIIAKRGEAIMPTVRMPDGTFGVKAVGGGMGGSTMFAPNINIAIDAKGRGGNQDGSMTPEQQQKLTQLLDDEINTHLQRKLEQWMRPGGPLARR